MTPKEYLAQYSDCKHDKSRITTEINSMCGEIDNNIISKRTEELKKIESKQMEIIESIDNVHDSTLRELLSRKYISCQTFDMIAEEMHYNPEYVKKGLHSRALIEFAKKIPEYYCDLPVMFFSFVVF